MTDSASKRKATEEAGGRSAKRQKVPGAGVYAVETPESTTTMGLKFLEAIRNARDKTGRGIVEEFLTLPEPKLVPGYYEQIRLPIALDTIDNKLRRREYANLTGVESDLKRLVQNAKDFNDKRSLIFEDAERVRKTASNWFVKYNPAYSDGSGYVAKPTPLPGETNGVPVTPGPTMLKITNKAAPVRTPAASKTPQPEVGGEADAEGEEEYAGLADFTGKTFQKAQEQLIQELIDYEDQGLQIFSPFHFLPPRTLTDYYTLIKYPVSLKAAQKRVRGQHGRNAATGVSDFQSWDAFAEEMSHIWKNAREYNEDGSDISLLASELEELFKERLAHARSQVEQPVQPKIKLNMGSNAAKQSGIKIKLNAPKASPSPAGTPAASGIFVDNEALQRQRDMVTASINGGRPASATGRNPFGSSRSGSASTPIPALHAHTTAGSPPAHTNGVKAEYQHGQSPALSAIRPTTAAGHLAPGSMPPPGVTSRPMSGSPHPQLQAPQLQAPLYQASANSYQPPQYHPPNGFTDNKNRPEGQTAANSILPSLTITSHPALQAPKPFKQIIRAHPRYTQQSLTFTVPASMHYFQIVPTLPPAVTAHAYRIFVMVNGQRLSEYIKPGEERDKGRPVFEARIERGSVGRVEVEVLAGKAGGKSGKEEVEWERCCVFIHVLRH